MAATINYLMHGHVHEYGNGTHWIRSLDCTLRSGVELTSMYLNHCGYYHCDKRKFVILNCMYIVVTKKKNNYSFYSLWYGTKLKKKKLSWTWNMSFKVIIKFKKISRISKTVKNLYCSICVLSICLKKEGQFVGRFVELFK